jgi:hypothetical protein
MESVFIGWEAIAVCCAVERGKKKTYDLPMATKKIQISSGEYRARVGVGRERDMRSQVGAAAVGQLCSGGGVLIDQGLAGYQVMEDTTKYGRRDG